MKFGIHNSSWLDSPDPAEAFEAVKAKAQWAENHAFVWFSVMDHMIQIPRLGKPDGILPVGAPRLRHGRKRSHPASGMEDRRDRVRKLHLSTAGLRTR